ncbi:hypothetical protein PGT21_005863 [Puccinia graminis f. sp. tritici]|uniref:Uncharacterized protein n=1 Tax=Puccinia graminis f. sp. tritici TaxID=56615 RepID=A0A5B0Q9S3_PUCGR|nr:hypothetical protein PGT21_005863 [Puccinia graminis f. sp. tritici]
MIHPPEDSSTRICTAVIHEEVDSDVEILSEHQVSEVEHPSQFDCTSDIEIIQPRPPKRPIDASTLELPQIVKKPRKRRSALTSSAPLVTSITGTTTTLAQHTHLIATIARSSSNTVLDTFEQERLRINLLSLSSGRLALKETFEIMKIPKNRKEIATLASPMTLEEFMLGMYTILRMVQESCPGSSLSRPSEITGASNANRMNRKGLMTLIEEMQKEAWGFLKQVHGLLNESKYWESLSSRSTAEHVEKFRDQCHAMRSLIEEHCPSHGKRTQLR